MFFPIRLLPSEPRRPISTGFKRQNCEGPILLALLSCRQKLTRQLLSSANIVPKGLVDLPDMGNAYLSGVTVLNAANMIAFAPADRQCLGSIHRVHNRLPATMDLKS
jgi:hypothetical protein